MKKIKAFISLILSIGIIMSIVPVWANAEKTVAEEYKFAEYTFDKNKEIVKNITHYWLQDSSGGQTRIVEKAGKRGIEVGNYGTWRFMLFNIDDAYWYSDEPGVVKITVEYFDEAGGYFYIRYGSPDSDHAESEKIEMKGTGEWKTAEIIIDDIRIANRDNLSDFMIATWCSSRGQSSKAVLVHSVKAEEIFPPKPIKSNITSKEPGNILNFENDEKKVNFEFENVTDFEGTARISEYVITNEDGKVISEGKTEDVKVPARGKAETVIDTKAYNCDLYRIDYTMTGEVPHGDEVQTFEVKDYGLFSIAQTWQEGDEKNKNYWIGAHLDFYRPYQDPVKTMRVIDLGGWGGARPGGILASWSGADLLAGTPTDGVFGFDWDSDLINSYDIGYIHIAGFGHPNLYKETIPGRGDKHMPRTEQEIQSYVDYCVAMAKDWDARGMKQPLRLEVWNEPNNTHFNSDLVQEDYKYYANLLKRIYPAVKAASPRTIVVGMVTVGSAVGWVQNVLSEGGYDAVDEVCIHPYSWGMGKSKFDSIINDTIAIQKFMEEKFGKAKPIIYSEIGWHDTGLLNETGSLGGTTYGITSMQQARNTVILPALSKVYKLTDLVCWYDLQNDGEIATSSENNFGLLESPYNRQPYAAKPSFLASCAYNKFMANAEHTGTIEVDGIQTAGYSFKRPDGKDCAILWTFNENDTLSVDFGCKSIDTYNLYGNPMGTMKSESGAYTFNLTGEPIYVMGNFGKFEKAENVFLVSDFTESVPDDLIPVEINDAFGRNLKVEVIPYDDEITVVGNTDMIAGKSSFSLKSSLESLGQHNIQIKIYDDNGTYYISDFTIWIRTPFKFDLKTKQLFADNLNRWQAVITVENNAYTTPMDGRIEITADKDCAEVANQVRFTALRPKESRTFYINLPEMVLKRTIDITAKTTLDSGYSEEYTGTVDFTTAHYAKTKPTIDGVMSDGEWEGFWVTSDRLENVEGALNGVDISTTWGGPEDLSLKAKFGWDEDNFYMLAVVKDNVFFNNEKVDGQWAADGIQYGFEDINDKGGNKTAAFTESGIALIDGKPQTYRWSTLYSDIKVGAYENFEAVIERNEETKETIYEMAIPWDEIFYPDYDVTKNKQLGFSMMVNESDGTGRRGWIKYNGGIGYTKDAKQFGTMILVK